MSEPRVFLDQDLRRVSSYEVARSIPLDCAVALGSSDLLLRFRSVSHFYGIEGGYTEVADNGLLMESLRRTLVNVDYPTRLSHAVGSSSRGATYIDLREFSDHPTIPCPNTPPVRPLGGPERPSEAQVVSGRGLQSDAVNEGPVGPSPHLLSTDKATISPVGLSGRSLLTTEDES